MDDRETIIFLRKENKVLRDRVEELEEIIGLKSKFIPTTKVPPHNLTPKELQIIEFIVKRKSAEYSQIFAAVWGGNSESRDDSLKVHVCRINKTTPDEYKIKGVWGKGFFVTDKAVEYWKSYLQKVYGQRIDEPQST